MRKIGFFDLFFRIFAKLLLLRFLSAHQVNAAAGVYRGPFGVVDGDTLRWRGDRVRLIGYDAPELPSEAGYAAKNHLSKLVKNKTAELHLTGARDKYGRLLGRLYVDGKEIVWHMLEAGHVYRLG